MAHREVEDAGTARLAANELLERHLPLIRRIIAAVCRQRRLTAEDAEDLRQETLLKLAENDCAALATFRGDSSLETFLTVVTTRSCIDEIRRRRGRWRPSHTSRKLGYAAVCLEELVHRDGLSYEEAVAKLLGEGVVRSREELDQVWSQIPAHPARAFVPQADAPEPLTTEDPEHQAQAREDEERVRLQAAVLKQVLTGLPPEDGLIIRRLFYDGRSVADVADELGLDQRPLYRRRDKLLKVLRRELERRGFRWPE